MNYQPLLSRVLAVRRRYAFTMKQARIVLTLLCGALIGMATTVGFFHFQRAQRVRALSQTMSEVTRIPSSLVTIGPGPSRFHHEYARRVRFDLIDVETATQQWVQESGKAGDSPATAKDIAPYLWPGTALQESCARGQCMDSLGNPIFIFTADIPPQLSRDTFERLSSVASKEYWSPYTVR